MNHQPKNPYNDDDATAAVVPTSEPWIGTQQLRPPPGTGTTTSIAASGGSSKKNIEQGTDKTETEESEESSKTSTSTGSSRLEEEKKEEEEEGGDDNSTKKASSSSHHHHQDQEKQEKRQRRQSRLRTLATPNGEVASLRPPQRPSPESESELESSTTKKKSSSSKSTNPSLTASATSEKQQSVARLSLATPNGDVHSIRPSLTESVASSSEKQQQSGSRLSLATPNGDVHSIRPSLTESVASSDVHSIRPSLTESVASSSEKQQSARLSLATPNGDVHSIRPSLTESVASSSEKQQSARLSLATPNGDVHSIRPPPSSTSLRASASSSASSSDEKQRIRLATPNGEVHTLIPTTTSNDDDDTRRRSPLRISNSNLRGSTATDVSTATEESTPQTGAFRVSQNGYVDDVDVDGGGVASSEELHSITQPTRTSSLDGLLEAIPIEAELAPQHQPAQQQQQQVDVEAIVEERIRERDRDLVVAEVASTTHHDDAAGDETATTFTQQNKRKRNLKIAIIVSIILAFVVVVLAVAFATTEGEEDDDDDYYYYYVTESPTPSPTIMSFNPTLQEVTNRDYVRCGAQKFDTGFSFYNTTTSKDDGFLIDICRAIAKVVLGDPEKYEIVYVTGVNRFQHLWDDEIDVLTQRATITMERDIASATNLTDGTNLGLSFSVPFHYTGMAFAGEPNYVDCADNFDSFSGDCRSLKICVRMGTTHETILNDIFPAPQKVLGETFEDVVENLENGRCNILVGDSVAIPESQLRALGYTGEYKLGTNLFSKEPLAIATRDGDTEWSNIVNMIINVLLTAEKLGITQNNVVAELGAGTTTDNDFIQDDDDFRSLFVDAISTIGNMGELYQRHLEKDFPRQGLNLLNTAAAAGNTTTGLIYSFPFGNFNTNGKITEDGGVMESILARQKLRCGVSKMDGRADFDADSWMWTGLDIEFCVAVSAAIFESSNAREQIEFVEISDTKDRLHSLASGEIDILAGERVTLQSIWKDPSTGTGYSFSPPYFYDDETGDSFALATIRNDTSTEFTDFVFWVVMSTFYAEENDITQSSPGEMPVVSLFGESLKQMFLDTIFAVDNYGNIYNKTMESLYPRIPGRNMLNLDNTPQVLAHPLN